jgi:uncharacterized protein YxjI
MSVGYGTLIHLRSIVHNKYVSVDRQGDLIADRNLAGDFESFTIEGKSHGTPIRFGDSVHIRSFAGKFITVSHAGIPIANRESPTETETLTILNADDPDYKREVTYENSIRFIARGGKILAVEPGGVVLASAKQFEYNWDKFQIVKVLDPVLLQVSKEREWKNAPVSPRPSDEDDAERKRLQKEAQEERLKREREQEILARQELEEKQKRAEEERKRREQEELKRREQEEEEERKRREQQEEEERKRREREELEKLRQKQEIEENERRKREAEENERKIREAREEEAKRAEKERLDREKKERERLRREQQEKREREEIERQILAEKQQAEKLRNDKLKEKMRIEQERERMERLKLEQEHQKKPVLLEQPSEETRTRERSPSGGPNKSPRMPKVNAKTCLHINFNEERGYDRTRHVVIVNADNNQPVAHAAFHYDDANSKIIVTQGTSDKVMCVIKKKIMALHPTFNVKRNGMLIAKCTQRFKVGSRKFNYITDPDNIKYELIGEFGHHFLIKRDEELFCTVWDNKEMYRLDIDSTSSSEISHVIAVCMIMMEQRVSTGNFSAWNL